MGTTTAIISGKGGVGKSTLTVGLGRALAQRGNKVLLLDCDAGLRALDKLTATEESLVYDSSDVVKGICEPIQAIYPVENEKGLFVMPAPLSADDILTCEQMNLLISALKPHYDHIILDAAAGVGRCFESVCSVAQKAIVVCNPDPVSVRGCNKVHGLLLDLGLCEHRLVINRFNSAFFEQVNVYDDLDKVIDESEMPLLGVIQEDYLLAAKFLKGQKADKKSPAMLSIKRIAARFEGDSVPIML